MQPRSFATALLRGRGRSPAGRRELKRDPDRSNYANSVHYEDNGILQRQIAGEQQLTVSLPHVTAVFRRELTVLTLTPN